MDQKGFEATVTLDETPNFKDTADKPLKSKEIQKRKVDINVLKARAQDAQNKENRKNILIFVFFLISLGAIGIYLSI
tara:strand:+ start:242 stop:472 length:231 start_codon:yes stop_codon:yes gene_type:complete